MIGSIKGNQQTEWKWMSYGASNISGVALYEIRNVQQGLIISAVWRLRYVPAGRRGRGPKAPPPPPPPQPHPTHHPSPHNPIPHPNWAPHVVRCCIDPSALDPEIKNRIIVSNLTRNIGLALTHRLCPLQYICSLSSSMINIHYPTNDYDYPPSKIVQLLLSWTPDNNSLAYFLNIRNSFHLLTNLMKEITLPAPENHDFPPPKWWTTTFEKCLAISSDLPLENKQQSFSN